MNEAQHRQDFHQPRGSLPRPQALIEVNQAKLEGRALDEKTYEARLQQAVEDVCRKQAELGIDVINDGEFGKDIRARSITALGRAMLGRGSAGGSRAKRAVTGARREA